MVRAATKVSLLVCVCLILASRAAERHKSPLQSLSKASLRLCIREKALRLRGGDATIPIFSEAAGRKRKGDSSSLNPNFSLNLSCLDGMRCLACLAVVFYHVHFFHGALFFLSTEPCFAAMRQTPIVGNLFFEISWHMTLFWLISGFLCERQLHQMLLGHQSQRKLTQGSTKDKSVGLTWRHYLRFFGNRVLRLYPLYVLLPMMIYKRDSGRPELQTPDMEQSRCGASRLWRALTFTMNFGKHDNLCAGPGWSLQNDIHGYLVIAIIFALTHKYTYNDDIENQKQYLRYKQLFWWGWYACSVLAMVASRPFPHQWLSGEALKRFLQSARLGLDVYNDRHLILLDVTSSGLADLFPGERDSPMMQSIRNFRNHQVFSTYFTSVARHGSAILLGSLLYSNLYERQGLPSNSLGKLLAAVTLLMVSQGSYIFSGLAMYWVTDVLLTFQRSHNAWSNAVHQFLSNPLFKAIVPYTYGIYLFHCIYLVTRIKKLTPIRAAAVRTGVDACHAGIQYNWQFIWKEAVTTFAVSLAVAVLLRRTYEFPFDWLRRRRLTGDASAAADYKKTV
jgi:peptidoglycan/LPS O-acetylase OafA/YrhL